MDFLIILQARMNSHRFFGKVIEEIIPGTPLLTYQIQRLKKSKRVNQILVATTQADEDQKIVDLAEQNEVLCFQGSENDVLDRYYQAAKLYQPKNIIRITGDCPLIDPKELDRLIDLFNLGEFDYASNVQPPTYPDGLDMEIMTYSALEYAWENSNLESDREHVTPFIRRLSDLESGTKFRSINMTAPADFSHIRLTVDYPEDLQLLRKLVSIQTQEGNWLEYITILTKNPNLLLENRHIIRNEGLIKSLSNDQYIRDTESKKTNYAKPTLTNSQAWLIRSKKVIPGAAQTFSKSCSQYVQGVAPIFLERGKGCHVWDVDNQRYIDFVQGLLPNILGYADDRVNHAVQLQLEKGISFTLPTPIEVELAENLCEIIPCAEMVRFGKNGSDATAAAVRVSRAITGKDYIACCGYHGWQDWYIGSTPRHLGVPNAVRELTFSFEYNNIESLERLLSEHPNKFAAIILEPMNFIFPEDNFLNKVRKLADKHNIILIFDEICSGFHFGLGGAQKYFNVTPDLACFGKAMGNGFPISAIVGRAEIMKEFENIFYSSTFGGETGSMAASLKVLSILKSEKVIEKLWDRGLRLKNGFEKLINKYNLENIISITGIPSWTLLQFKDHPGQDSFLIKSFFQQECIKRGILILSTHNLSYSHTDLIIDQTLEIYAEVLELLSFNFFRHTLAEKMEGEVISPIFKVR